MNDKPRCIACSEPLDHDSYLGFCSNCSILCSNPVSHMIIGVIAAIIGFFVFRKIYGETDYGSVKDYLGGAAVFALTAFGWNFLTSIGVRAGGIVSGILKFSISPFVGLVGFPVILFRVITYKSQN